MPLSNAERQQRHRLRVSLRNADGHEVFRMMLELKAEIASLRNELCNGAPNGFDKEKGTQKETTSLTLSTPFSFLSETEFPHGGKRSFEGDFDNWWKGYPHKVGKGAALKAFQKVRKAGVPLEALTDGVRRYVAHKPAERPWCNPATWLNQERWNDVFANGLDTGVPERRPPSEAERQSAIAEILDDLKQRGLTG